MHPGSVRVDTISPWSTETSGRDSPGGTDHLNVIRTEVFSIVTPDNPQCRAGRAHDFEGDEQIVCQSSMAFEIGNT
jgi:hypothetical protein